MLYAVPAREFGGAVTGCPEAAPREDLWVDRPHGISQPGHPRACGVQLPRKGPEQRDRIGNAPALDHYPGRDRCERPALLGSE